MEDMLEVHLLTYGLSLLPLLKHLDEPAGHALHVPVRRPLEKEVEWA